MSAKKPKAEQEAWEDPYRKPRSYKWIGVLLLLPVLYVLSFGPAAVLYSKKKISAQLFYGVYGPLGKFAEKHETSERLLNWYADLWGK